MNVKLRGLLILSMTLAVSAWGFQQAVPGGGGRGGGGAGVGSLVTFHRILVSFRPILTSEGGQRIVQGRTYVGSDAIQRVIFNADGSFYFGYDFVVEAVPNSSQFLVTVKALSPESLQKFQSGIPGGGGAGGRIGGAAGARVGGGGGGVGGGAVTRGAPTVAARVDSAPVQPNVTFLPSQYPASQRVSDGDVLSMEILANPETGGKISDIIKVASTHRIMMQNSSAAGVQAGQVPDTSNIWAFGFDVVVDGKLTASVGSGGCNGRLVHFSLKPQQRFIMSTQAWDRYDFSLAGTIEGNSIRFKWNGSTYELLCSEPVLEGGASAPLWLLVDDGPGAPELMLQLLTARLDTVGGVARSGGGGVAGGAGAGGRGVGAGGGVARGAGGTGSAERMPAPVSCGAANSIESLIPKK